MTTHNIKRVVSQWVKVSTTLEGSRLASFEVVPGLEGACIKDGTVMGTVKAANMIQRVASRWIEATRTPAEKEDDEISRLHRKSPKHKPPRHDSRSPRLRVVDPDMKDHDPDMSLNRKDVGG